jgi:hypothetical protein
MPLHAGTRGGKTSGSSLGGWDTGNLPYHAPWSSVLAPLLEMSSRHLSKTYHRKVGEEGGARSQALARRREQGFVLSVDTGHLVFLVFVLI